MTRAIKSVRMRRACSTHVASHTNAYKICVRKPEAKKPLVRPRRRTENGIEKYHK